MNRHISLFYIGMRSFFNHFTPISKHSSIVFVHIFFVLIILANEAFSAHYNFYNPVQYFNTYQKMWFVQNAKKPSQDFKIHKKETVLSIAQANNLPAYSVYIFAIYVLLAFYTKQYFFENLLESLAKKLNCNCLIAPVKNLYRIIEKAKQDYNGNITKVTDIIRGSLVFSNLRSLYRGLNYIKKHCVVCKIKDRFANPSKVGYRDVQLVIELEPGIPAEIQLHLPEILQAKRKDTKLYSQRRKLESALKMPTLSHKSLAETFKSKLQTNIDAIENKQKKLYQKAWEDYKNRLG